MCDTCKKINELQGLKVKDAAAKVFALVEEALKKGGDREHLSEITNRALGLQVDNYDAEAEAAAFVAFERKRNP